jgi:hypothetical protein
MPVDAVSSAAGLQQVGDQAELCGLTAADGPTKAVNSPLFISVSIVSSTF